MSVVRIAKYEFWYMLQSLQTYVTFLIFFSIAFLLTANAGEFQSFASGGQVLANSPYSITDSLLKFSVLAFFVVPVYLANAILRDVNSQFESIVFALPIKPKDYLLGRFFGAYGALVIAYSGGAVGMWLGSLWPLADAELLGPQNIWHYVFIYFSIIVPTLFFISVIVFSAAVLTRSLIFTHMVALGLFVAYLIIDLSNSIAPIFDPFMIDVFREQTKYWTALERNTQLIVFDYDVIANRLFWFVVALTLFFISWWKFSFKKITQKAFSLSLLKRKTKDINHQSGAMSQRMPDEFGDSVWDKNTALKQMKARWYFEVKLVSASLPFILLMLITTILLAIGLTDREALYDVNTLPVTRVMIESIAILKLPLLIVTVFYSSEIMWRERNSNCHEIFDAIAMPNWVMVTSKLLALFSILLLIVLLGVVTAILLQVMSGYEHIDYSLYLQRSLTFDLLPVIYLAVLTFFFQVLIKNHYAGMCLFAAFLLVIVTSRDTLGIEHPLLSFVFPAVGAPLSDINGIGRFMEYGYWMRIYWGAIAILLLISTYLLWPRGTWQPLSYRLRYFKSQLFGRLGVIVVGSVLLAFSSATFIYYNTHYLNDYFTDNEVEQLLVNYEKRYRQYENLPMPKIVAVKNQVEIFPYQRKVETQSTHLLQNKTSLPITDIHFVFPPSVEVAQFEINQEGEVIHQDDFFNYYIFELQQPMLPGQQLSLDFTTRIEQKGFPHKDPDISLVRNGTFIFNNQLTPSIGFQADHLIKDNRIRQRYGLAPISQRPKLEETQYLQENVHRKDSDFIDFETTISTVEEQTAVAPGKLVKQWLSDGRRFFHYKSETPIRNFYAYQSAEYTITSDSWKDVEIEIYHHPTHQLNVHRMIAGVKDSLDIFSREFSPYQYQQLRIIEFPAYRMFAQSLPNTIPYSEGIGFIADVQPDDIDMPYYVTAHEMAHQWWGHQVVAANMQGDGFIHETLAQYSALLVMENRYGPHQVRQFLRYELDRYLSGRADDPIGELPLYRVEKQPYIYYRKGALAMYMLRDYLGGDVVNGVLKQLVQKRAYSASPYTSSLDLLKLLKQASSEKHHSLIDDLFKKIVLYDVKVVNSQVSQNNDGTFRVSINVETRKSYFDSQGNQTEAELDIPIDIGLFERNPAEERFNNEDVILLEKRMIQGRKQTIEIVTNKRPRYVGIDPYNKLIDRQPDDNISEVTASP